MENGQAQKYRLQGGDCIGLGIFSVLREGIGVKVSVSITVGLGCRRDGRKQA